MNPVSKAEKIKELAATCTLTDAYLMLQEVSDLKARMSLELDLIREREMIQQREYKKIISEAQELMTQLRGLHRVNLKFLNLVCQPQKRKPKGNRDSNGKISVNYTRSG